jgi:hypothetical protein
VQDDAENQALSSLLETGTDAIGSVAGAAVGLTIGGPPGALIGAGAGPLVTSVFRRIAFEIKHRCLGSREEVRVGEVFVYALARISERLEAGEEPRADGFFDERPDDRPDAEEVLEATLLAAQRDPAEKKLKYYGNLLANVSFEPGIAKPLANQLIRQASNISYQQLCLLFLFSNQGREGQLKLREENYRPAHFDATDVTLELAGLLQEIFELYTSNMLNAAGSALLGIADVKPASMRTQATGAALYNLMELWSLPIEDIEPVARLLT